LTETARVTLMCFATATGTAADNVQLARGRVQRLETAFSSCGVAVAELIALGAAIPVAANDTPFARTGGSRSGPALMLGDS